MKSLEKDLQYVDVSKISFDIANPRGEKPHQILSDKEFGKLVSSVKEYGLLEPLIVKKDEVNQDAFLLIDGERRLRAVQKIAESETGVSLVPVLVAKDDMDGRILAYQVHMLRKNWNKAAETQSIKQIINDVKAANPGINDSDLKKELKKITAHKDHEIDDILKMLKYDDDIIAAVLSGELDMSYLIQIESSFIRPLNRKYPSIVNKFGEDTIRQTLAKKASQGLLKKTRFLMEIFKNVFNEKKEKGKVEAILTEFIENKDKSIVDSYKEYEALSTGKKGTSKNKKKTPVSGKATSGTGKKPVVSPYKDVKVTKKQQISLEDIQKKIQDIAGVFSKEEYDYISEGYDCLKMHCFKAAVLMLWATAVSRIINYIESNLGDFNKCSGEMKAKQKNSWKHFAKNFKDDYTDTEEILVQANDTHLLCYLAYKKFISAPEFKRLKSVYDLRNDCAHPTNVDISVNEVIVAFENVYKLILNNKNLQ